MSRARQFSISLSISFVLVVVSASCWTKADAAKPLEFVESSLDSISDDGGCDCGEKNNTVWQHLPTTAAGWEAFLRQGAELANGTTWVSEPLLARDPDIDYPPGRYIHFSYVSAGQQWYNKFRKRVQVTALNSGEFSESRVYSKRDMDPGFRQFCRDVLSRKRGDGYWIWKAYFAIRELYRCQNLVGSQIWYSDADMEWQRSPEELESEWTNSPIWIMQGYHSPRRFTKRDAVVLILGPDDDPKLPGRQLTAGLFGAKCGSPTAMRIMRAWLYYGCDPRASTDDPNVLGYPNFPEFTDHRHDQAILTLLAMKFNIPTHQQANHRKKPIVLF